MKPSSDNPGAKVNTNIFRTNEDNTAGGKRIGEEGWEDRQREKG